MGFGRISQQRNWCVQRRRRRPLMVTISYAASLEHARARSQPSRQFTKCTPSRSSSIIYISIPVITATLRLLSERWKLSACTLNLLHSSYAYFFFWLIFFFPLLSWLWAILYGLKSCCFLFRSLSRYFDNFVVFFFISFVLFSWTVWFVVPATHTI